MPWSQRRTEPNRLRGRALQRRNAIELAQEKVCRVCWKRPASQMDHILNLAAGGADTRDNRQGICIPCHNAKTAREAAAARPSRIRPSEPHPGDVGVGG